MYKRNSHFEALAVSLPRSNESHLLIDCSGRERRAHTLFDQFSARTDLPALGAVLGASRSPLGLGRRGAGSQGTVGGASAEVGEGRAVESAKLSSKRKADAQAGQKAHVIRSSGGKQVYARTVGKGTTVS